MKEITHKLTCRELYEKVWATPIMQLAKEFGLSDVGLAKICKKNSIPCPSRGYWEKLRAGQKMKKPALPNAVSDKSITINGYLIEEGDQVEKFSPSAFYAEAMPLIDAESMGKNKIVVPKQLRSSDVMVRNTLKELREGHRDKYNRVHATGPGMLDVSVSKENVDRSMRIIAGLIGALNIRKYTVSSHAQNYFPWLTRIHLLDQVVTFRLREKISRRPYDPIRDHKRYDLQIQILGSPPKFVFGPNGKLALQITNAPHGYDIKEEFIDSEKTPLENQLNQFVANATKTVFAITHIEAEREKARQDRIERERQSEQRLHQEQIAKEKVAQQKRREKEKVNYLIHQAESRRKSIEIIEFIHEVEAKWIELTGSINPGSEIATWMDWAMHQAEAIDPLSGGWPWQSSNASDLSI